MFSLKTNMMSFIFLLIIEINAILDMLSLILLIVSILFLFLKCSEEKNGKDLTQKKICELAYAKFQGKQELINHYEKGSVMEFETDDLKPLIIPTPAILPKIEIPIKYFNTFAELYRFSDCTIQQDKFIVNAFFKF